MKFIYSIVLGILLTSCGGMNQWNHSKLKKVRVHVDKKEAIVSEVDFAKLDKEESILEFEQEAITEEVQMEVENHVVSDEVVENEFEAVSESKVQEKDKLVSKEVVQKASKVKSYKKELRKGKVKKTHLKKKRGIDWSWIPPGFIALALLGLLVIGFIFAPEITLIVLAVAAIAIAVGIVYVVFQIFAELFCLFLDC